MAKREKPKITVISYVRKGGELVRFDSLSAEEREMAARTLLLRYLNGLYRGQAEFFYNDEEGA